MKGLQLGMKMTKYTGRNSKETHRMNLSLILRILFEQGPTSRLFIKKTMGLSQAAITLLTQELIEAGLIMETGIANFQDGAGRPSQNLRLVSQARFLIGVELSWRTLKVGLFDLKVEPYKIVAEDIYPGTTDNQILTRIAEIIQQFYQEYNFTTSRVLGIGAGVAGIIDSPNGLIKFLPGFGWKDFPFAERLAELTGLPVVVNNNVQNMVLAEKWLGNGRKKDNLLLLHVGSGVGSGVFLWGRPFYGSVAGAGEIGHMVINDEGPPCRCGRVGCLEALVAEPALCKRAREKGIAADPTISDLIQLALKGEPGAREIFSQAGRYLGIAIVNILNIFGQMDVILSGTIFKSGEIILEPLHSILYSKNTIMTFDNKIEMTAFSGKLGIYGAAILGVMEFFFNTNALFWNEKNGPVSEINIKSIDDTKED